MTWCDERLELSAFRQAKTGRADELGEPLLAPSAPVGKGALDAVLAQIDGSFPVALAFDGTMEGLLSCMFVAFACRACIEDVVEGSFMQLRLGQRCVVVPADIDAAQRVQRSICRSLGEASWRAVAAACASDDPSRANAVLAFLRYALSHERTAPCNACEKKATCATACSKIPGNRLMDEWASPHVAQLLALQRSVANEAERMRQFIRFEHADGDLWYARCNPSCSVVPFIMGHFARRFNSQRFIIYDEVHQLAGISQKGRWQLVRTDELPVPSHSNEEAEMQDAWRRFYRVLSIDERYHPELRRQFMPTRLWKNLTELNALPA